MTFTTILNSTLLNLGPIVVTYFAYDMNTKGGQIATMRAAAVYILCQSIKLVLMALVTPILLLVSSGDEVYLQQTQILLNSAATPLIEGFALYKLLSDKKLMPHVPRKSTKIMAIALGWAFSEITSLRLVKILTSEF